MCSLLASSLPIEVAPVIMMGATVTQTMFAPTPCHNEFVPFGRVLHVVGAPLSLRCTMVIAFNVPVEQDRTAWLYARPQILRVHRSGFRDIEAHCCFSSTEHVIRDDNCQRYLATRQQASHINPGLCPYINTPRTPGFTHDTHTRTTEQYSSTNTITPSRLAHVSS